MPSLTKRPGRAAPGPSSRTRAHRAPRPSASVWVPATIAVAYCLYVAFIAGENGRSTGRAWLIALVSAGLLGVLSYLLGRWQHGRRPEAVGAGHGVLFGCAMGYLLSLNDHWSVLKACGVGLALGVSMAVSAYYVVHTNATGLGSAKRRDPSAPGGGPTRREPRETPPPRRHALR